MEHEIRNAAASPMVLAPWAITQLRPGGVAVVPDPPRGSGPQADRSIVFWPYTDPGDGRMCYRLDGRVFGKQVRLDPDGSYPDRGAALQVYVCDAFCELETVGVVRTLEPGETASHRELWTLSLDPDQERSIVTPGGP